MIPSFTWQQAIVCVTAVISIAAVLVLKGNEQVITAVAAIAFHTFAPSVLSKGSQQ